MQPMTASLALLTIVAAPMGAALPAQAQTPAAPASAQPFGPPRGFVGYSQPDIGASLCRNINVTQTVCTIPAMTAGRYKVHAIATSTSQGQGALQAMSIQVGSRACGRIDNKSPWPSGARTVRLDCEIVVMTDRPLQVSALYADAKATKDPRGPILMIERLPWEGVLSTQVSAPKQ